MESKHFDELSPELGVLSAYEYDSLVFKDTSNFDSGI